jgi:hypothetical protein
VHRLRAVVIPAALLLLLLAAVPVHAASPEPSADSGDTRTSGEPPGFIGAPLFAIGGVLLIGLLAAGATIAYVRLTGGPGPAGADATASSGAPSAATRPAATRPVGASGTPPAAARPAAATAPTARPPTGSPAIADEARTSGPAVRQ